MNDSIETFMYLKTEIIADIKADFQINAAQ